MYKINTLGFAFWQAVLRIIFQRRTAFALFIGCSAQLKSFEKKAALLHSR